MKRVMTNRNGLSTTPEYRAWRGMIGRCHNDGHPAFANYGGRGITVCDRWRHSLEAFLEDMGPKPSLKHEIDRIHNDAGYSPENCRWVSRKENDRNRRSNRLLTFRGETLALAAWCERLGLPRDTVRKRLEAGWSVDASLTTPTRPKARNGEAPPKVSAPRVTKLTAATVAEIRFRNSAGESQRDLAKVFGVAKSTIGKIVRRERWRAA